MITRRLWIYIFLIISFNIICSSAKCVAAAKDSYVTYRDQSYSKKYISIKVVSVTSKKIKIKIENRGRETYLYSAQFKIYKYKNGKWRKISYRKNAKVAKCLYKIESNDSKIIKMKWKKYFYTKYFKRGKYKIVWMSNCRFRIKNGN